MVSRELFIFKICIFHVFDDVLDDVDEDIANTKMGGFVQSMIHTRVGDEFESHFRLF